MMLKEDNIINNNRIQYVSFDIFDTIIGRYTPYPAYVFELMRRFAADNHIILPENFQMLRRKAETIASKKKEFFNIFDIYDSLEYSLDSELIEKLIYIELYVECQLSFPIPERISLMEKMAGNGIHVILISDMYWPRNLLIKILEKNNIHCYEKIFVSCDEQASKSNGKLYKKVMTNLSIRHNEIIHIGDNLKSDYWQSWMNGIKAIHVKSKINKSNHSALDWQVMDRYITYKVNSSMSEYWKYGYSVMGPVLWKYVSWLEELCKRENIDKIFFLSRDGYIMRKAYQMMGCDIPSEYMYASRRALIVPIIWMTPDIEDVVKLFFTSRDESVKGIMSKIGLSYLDYGKQLNLFGLDADDRVDVKNIGSSKFGEFYNSIKDDVINNSKEQYELLNKYLDRISFKGKVAIVDIGWFGDMQRALKRVLTEIGKEVELTGLYLGIVPKSQAVFSENLVVHGMLFEGCRPEKYIEEQSFNTLVEWMFGAMHGTVLGYLYEGGNIEPDLDSYEYDNSSGACVDEKRALKQFQRGALEFVKDISANTILRYLSVSVDDVSRELFRLGTSPTMKETMLFGDLRFIASDANYRFIAKPRKFSEYVMHMSLLKSDFRLCAWRIGFLKRLCKANFPYGKLYLKLRGK